MNNYDDIKRFKEKLNMEAIDYKEIAENNPNSSASSWSIIKQIVNADKPFHPLEQGHSTLPSPAPISQQEFSARPAASDVAPAPLPSAIAAAGPAYGPSVLSPLFNAVEKAMPPQPATGAPPFRAIDGGSRATGPGSVFDQLTQRAASAPAAPGTAPTPLPTAGGASALQGHEALMAAPPRPGQSTDGPGKTPVESPFAQPQAPGRVSGMLPPQGNPFAAPNASHTPAPFAQPQAPGRVSGMLPPQGNPFAAPNALHTPPATGAGPRQRSVAAAGQPAYGAECGTYPIAVRPGPRP